MKQINLQTELVDGSNLPKYMQIANLLDKQLTENALPPGSRLPSNRQLIRKLHTTPVTLNRALNELARRGLIERKVGSGTFAASPGRDKKRRIGIFCHDIANPNDSYTGPILQVIRKYWSDKGYAILLLIAEPKEYEKLILEYELSGVIVLCPLESFFPKIEKLVNAEIPIVSIGYAMPRLDGIAFGTDHELAAKQAVMYLVSRGYTKIGFLSRSSEKAGDAIRRRGWAKGMYEAKLSMDPDWELRIDDRLEANLSQLLADGLLPEAFIIPSSFYAIDVCNVCRRAHIDIPNRLALVGLDDDAYTVRLDPPLTVFAQKTPDFTLAAQDALFRRMQSQPPVFARPSAYEAELIERSSSLDLTRNSRKDEKLRKEK